MQRVVVTGIGPVTPIGIGADAFLEGQHQARNGIRTITRFDTSDLTVHIAGEVDVDVEAYIERKEVRRLDRFVQYALIGSELAIADAGLSEDDVRGEHAGTCVGSGVGGGHRGCGRRCSARWRGVQACGLRCTKWWRATW